MQLLVLKTYESETAIGELVKVSEDNLIYHIRLPIKILTQITQLKNGISNSSIPVLYMPFCGDNVYPFKSSFFISISQCHPLDFLYTWYIDSVKSIMASEMKTMLTMSEMKYRNQFPDKYIFTAPEIIQ
jgi:hypothetical protein